MFGKTLPQVLVIAVASSAATLFAEQALRPSPVKAQQGTGSLREYLVYAAPRGDGGVSESFIFVNPTTGDIWVYENENLKEHYRVVAVGEKLLEVKR